MTTLTTLSIITGNGTALVSDTIRLQSGGHVGSLSLAITVTTFLNGTSSYRFTPTLVPTINSGFVTWYTYTLSEADVNFEATVIQEQLTYTWESAIGAVAGVLSLSGLILKVFFIQTPVVRSLIVCRCGSYSDVEYDPANVAGKSVITDVLIT